MHSKPGWGYLIIWEFHVAAEEWEQFEMSYGPEGDWAKLFRRSPEYLGTELAHDDLNPERYLTLDFWTSERAFHEFKDKHSEEYALMDMGFERLTSKELRLGTFTKAG